jgi:CheY-like chemotaxis protein
MKPPIGIPIGRIPRQLRGEHGFEVGQVGACFLGGGQLGAREEVKLPVPDGPLDGALLSRVLVVDDDPRVTQTLTRILCRDHFVATVDRGAAALELLASGARFDAILCDIDTPGMTGVEFFREVERLSPEVAARVGFLIAGSCSSEMRDFLRRSGSPCVEKPFRLQELRRAVETLAGGSADS